MRAKRGRSEEFLDTTTCVRKINGNSMDGLGKTRGNHIVDVNKMMLKSRGSREKPYSWRQENGRKCILPGLANHSEQRTNRGKWAEVTAQERRERLFVYSCGEILGKALKRLGRLAQALRIWVLRGQNLRFEFIFHFLFQFLIRIWVSDTVAPVQLQKTSVTWENLRFLRYWWLLYCWSGVLLPSGTSQNFTFAQKWAEPLSKSGKRNGRRDPVFILVKLRIMHILRTPKRWKYVVLKKTVKNGGKRMWKACKNRECVDFLAISSYIIGYTNYYTPKNP